MSRWQKLLIKINSLSKEVRFDELRKVLESYGYRMDAPSGGSSHRTFRKAGSRSLTIPVSNPIKLTYVKMVKNLIEEKEAENENN